MWHMTYLQDGFLTAWICPEFMPQHQPQVNQYELIMSAQTNWSYRPQTVECSVAKPAAISNGNVSEYCKLDTSLTMFHQAEINRTNDQKSIRPAKNMLPSFSGFQQLLKPNSLTFVLCVRKYSRTAYILSNFVDRGDMDWYTDGSWSLFLMTHK